MINFAQASKIWCLLTRTKIHWSNRAVEIHHFQVLPNDKMVGPLVLSDSQDPVTATKFYNLQNKRPFVIKAGAVNELDV
jgi:hypothetical protein